jgi:hypothetical protein
VGRNKNQRIRKFKLLEVNSRKLNAEVVGACLAGKYVGKEIIVEGKVTDTHRSLKSNTVF